MCRAEWKYWLKCVGYEVFEDRKKITVNLNYILTSTEITCLHYKHFFPGLSQEEEAYWEGVFFVCFCFVLFCFWINLFHLWLVRVMLVSNTIYSDIIQYNGVLALENSIPSPFVEFYQFKDGTETKQKKRQNGTPFSKKKRDAFSVYKIYLS